MAVRLKMDHIWMRCWSYILISTNGLNFLLRMEWTPLFKEHAAPLFQTSVLTDKRPKKENPMPSKRESTSSEERTKKESHKTVSDFSSQTLSTKRSYTVSLPQLKCLELHLPAVSVTLWATYLPITVWLSLVAAMMKCVGLTELRSYATSIFSY